MFFIFFDNNFGLKLVSLKINIYFLVFLYVSYRLVYVMIRFIKKFLLCKSFKLDSIVGDRVRRIGFIIFFFFGLCIDVLYLGL